MTKLHVAYLSHRKDDGTSLRLDEVTLPSLLLEDLGYRAGTLLDAVTFGWTYEVRWGPKDAEYGLADRSLGHQMFRLAQWAALGFGTDRERRAVACIPVSAQWVKENMPDAGYPFDGSEPREGDLGNGGRRTDT